MREFIDFFSEWEPRLGSAVRGVTEPEIGELESLVGDPLPSGYRDFLTTMGANLGPFSLSEYSDFRFPAVLKFYRSTTWRPRDSSLFIGNDFSGSGMEFFLERQGERAIVRLPAGDEFFRPLTLYPGFENMMFLVGYQTLRMAHLPHRRTFTPYGGAGWNDAESGTRIERFHLLAKETGFVPVPHTGAWAAGFERSNSCLTCYQAPGFGPLFSLASHSRQAFDEISDTLSEELALIGHSVS
jgi:hypothetical protein